MLSTQGIQFQGHEGPTSELFHFFETVYWANLFAFGVSLLHGAQACVLDRGNRREGLGVRRCFLQSLPHAFSSQVVTGAWDGTAKASRGLGASPMSSCPFSGVGYHQWHLSTDLRSRCGQLAALLFEILLQTRNVLGSPCVERTESLF